jgi:predicted nuclease with TOPRIM domain
MQSHKELLTTLQPALELKKARKAALKAELRSLTAEIEADEKKMTELPESMEKIRQEALAALNAGRQLKTKLFALSKTQESDQRLLENINKTISDASNVISKYWVYNCNKQFVAECLISFVVLLFVSLYYFLYLSCLILTSSFWMTHSAILTVIVSDPKNDLTTTQPNLDQSNRI